LEDLESEDCETKDDYTDFVEYLNNGPREIGLRMTTGADKRIRTEFVNPDMIVDDGLVLELELELKLDSMRTKKIGSMGDASITKSVSDRPP
jgi:hypothetical protein